MMRKHLLSFSLSLVLSLALGFCGPLSRCELLPPPTPLLSLFSSLSFYTITFPLSLPLHFLMLPYFSTRSLSLSLSLSPLLFLPVSLFPPFLLFLSPRLVLCSLSHFLVFSPFLFSLPHSHWTSCLFSRPTFPFPPLASFSLFHSTYLSLFICFSNSQFLLLFFLNRLSSAPFYLLSSLYPPHSRPFGVFFFYSSSLARFLFHLMSFTVSLSFLPLDFFHNFPIRLARFFHCKLPDDYMPPPLSWSFISLSLSFSLSSLASAILPTSEVQEPIIFRRMEHGASSL